MLKIPSGLSTKGLCTLLHFSEDRSLSWGLSSQNIQCLSFFTKNILCSFVRTHTDLTAHVWRSEGNLEKSVLSSHHVDLGWSSGHRAWQQEPLLAEPSRVPFAPRPPPPALCLSLFLSCFRHVCIQPRLVCHSLYY